MTDQTTNVTSPQSVGWNRNRAKSNFPARMRRYRDIVREFAVSDFRLRYHDSLLGYVWFLLSPAMMFGVYYFVFTQVIYIAVPNFALYLILGIISYNFFQDCTFSAMYSLTAKAPIIKKMFFPRSLIIIAASLTAVLSLLVNLGIVLLVVLVIDGVPPLLWLIPIPVLCLFLFATGVGFFLSAIYVRFRDLTQIWNVMVLAIFWLTPVVYDVSSLPESTQIIVFLNPLARIFMLFRHYLLYNFYDTQFLLITVLSSLFVFLAGLWVFRRNQDKFAELL